MSYERTNIDYNFIYLSYERTKNRQTEITTLYIWVMIRQTNRQTEITTLYIWVMNGQTNRQT